VEKIQASHGSLRSPGPVLFWLAVQESGSEPAGGRRWGNMGYIISLGMRELFRGVDQQFQMWIKEYFFPMAEKIIPLFNASR
jgi:hypothetical protein